MISKYSNIFGIPNLKIRSHFILQENTKDSDRGLVNLHEASIFPGHSQETPSWSRTLQLFEVTTDSKKGTYDSDDSKVLADHVMAHLTTSTTQTIILGSTAVINQGNSSTGWVNGQFYLNDAPKYG